MSDQQIQRALRELDDDLEPPKKNVRGSAITRSTTGIYEAKPEHFNQPWPTVRTQTFVEMVFGTIQKKGLATYDDIVEDTGLHEDVVGMALADLIMWTPGGTNGKRVVRHECGRVVSKDLGDVRVYSVNDGGNQ